MGESLGVIGSISTTKRGARVHLSALRCTGIHARVARAIWPSKTAENWAAAAGRKSRIAKDWLSGRAVSEAGKLAIIRELD